MSSRFLIFAVTVLASLALAGSAQAATTIIAPVGSTVPYQRWVDEAKVPTPDVTLTVVESQGGCEGEGSACTHEGETTIWLDPAPFGDEVINTAYAREALLHEVGHQASYRMPGWALSRFETMRGDARPWRSPPNSPHEQFAEAWRLCAENARGRAEAGYDYNASGSMQRRVCRLIRRVS